MGPWEEVSFFGNADSFATESIERRNRNSLNEAEVERRGRIAAESRRLKARNGLFFAREAGSRRTRQERNCGMDSAKPIRSAGELNAPRRKRGISGKTIPPDASSRKTSSPCALLRNFSSVLSFPNIRFPF